MAPIVDLLHRTFNIYNIVSSTIFHFHDIILYVCLFYRINYYFPTFILSKCKIIMLSYLKLSLLSLSYFHISILFLFFIILIPLYNNLSSFFSHTIAKVSKISFFRKRSKSEHYVSNKLRLLDDPLLVYLL